MAPAPAPEPAPLLSKTWSELRRRKVVRAAATYAVVAWVVLQLGEVTFEPLGLPPWVMTWTILLAILGFPVVLVLAWVFDRDGDGLSRDRAGAGVGPARVSAVVMVLLTVGALAWWLTDVYRDDDATMALATGPAGPEAAAAAPVADAAPGNAIAVLPFEDLSADGDQGWFADGLAEELLDRLARVDGLKVAARTSSFALRDRALDVVGIGRALKVASVVEGSVRKADGLLRVSVQLVDARNGFQLWSQRYERPDQAIFDLQDEITADIVGNLRQRLPDLQASVPSAVEQATTRAADTRDVQAHELYLQGRVHWRQRTPSALARAAALFEQALARDPDYARAWSGLADSQLLLADYGGLRAADAVARAEPAVIKAIDLAPGLGEAWASLGLLRMTAGQLDAAEGNLREAIRLDPGYDMALMWLGGLYGMQGKLKARTEILTRARELSPLDAAINVNLASNLFASGEADAARRMLTDLLAVIPDSNLARRNLADFERTAGHLADALREADRAWRQDEAAPASLVSLAMVLATLERFEEADRVVSRLPDAMFQKAVLRAMFAQQRDRRTVLPPPLVERVDRLLASTDPLPEEEQPLLRIAAIAAFWQDDDDRAARVLEKMAETSQRSYLLPWQLDAAQVLLVVYRQQGRRADVERLQALTLSSYLQMRDQGLAGTAVDYGEAAMHAFDGEIEAALVLLRRAVEGGFSERWLLAADPRLVPLHELPSYRAIDELLAARIAREREASLAIARY